MTKRALTAAEKSAWLNVNSPVIVTTFPHPSIVVTHNADGSRTTLFKRGHVYTEAAWRKAIAP